MELVYDTEAVKAFYDVKSEQFFYLANYLNVCKFFLECPIKDTIDAGPFPPTDENYNRFFDETNLDENETSIELDTDPFPPSDENDKIFSDKIKSIEMIDLNKEKSEDFDMNELNDLSFNLSSEFIREGKMIIENINFHDYKSFSVLSDFCLVITELYNLAKSQKRILQNIKILKETDTVGHLTTGKAYELIGYWKAKMEEKRRNYLNTKPKTLKRKSNEEVIKNLLKKYNFKPNKKFLIEAQKGTEREGRTIKNFLKSKIITEYIKNNINK